MLRRSYIVLCVVAALLVMGVGIVIDIVLCSAPAQTGYEAEKRVENWILNVRVTPENTTVDDNITIDATVEYTGSDNFSVRAIQPFVN
jgi:dolichol kinase